MMQNIQDHYVLARISNCLSQKLGKIGKKSFFCSILLLSSQRSIASEVSTAVGKEIVMATLTEAATATVEEISKSLAPACAVVACIDAGVRVYSAGKDVKSYFYPSKEEQSRISNASKQLRVATARSKFKHCLINNKSTSKIDSSGRPTECKEVERIFKMCGGEREVTDIIKVFNNMRKGQN